MENGEISKPQPKHMSRFNQINFRAGILGFPFCGVEYYLKREPIFLLGGGFFAALLIMGFLEWRRSGYARIWASHAPNVKKHDQADNQ
jgi:hypothetical protein